jgi:hypothetical protein
LWRLPCPSWVKNGPDALEMGSLFYPPKADIGQLRRHGGPPRSTSVKTVFLCDAPLTPKSSVAALLLLE